VRFIAGGTVQQYRDQQDRSDAAHTELSVRSVRRYKEAGEAERV